MMCTVRSLLIAASLSLTLPAAASATCDESCMVGLADALVDRMR